jgi:hypothetical protein
MAIYRCDVYPFLNVYLPEHEQTIHFFQGQLDTAIVPEPIRAYAEEVLGKTPYVYPDDLSYRCDECGKKFDSQRGLQAHINFQHKPRVEAPDPVRGLGGGRVVSGPLSTTS